MLLLVASFGLQFALLMDAMPPSHSRPLMVVNLSPAPAHRRLLGARWPLQPLMPHARRGVDVAQVFGAMNIFGAVMQLSMQNTEMIVRVMRSSRRGSCWSM